ncbi:TIGR04211 family SH3 domain-containing protein [Kineobactrum sediminis]|uniref:TIGR04211 family SH3 domain-containing protein n=1 Tax=Kineobactrum sediminis TaxID=1905677 RepID=A0A2N5Y0N4_9GAMM|nr:TIGR04211 family SH3 domain-containing protein [Kineobactrum sediminis]PLW81964.1 TIGR04211 family SH3 domain-containing protein [Kineobactrum sediminis]
MQRIFIRSLLVLLMASPALAQDIRYVRDTLYVQLRTEAGEGAGTVLSSLPSGTVLTVNGTTANGEWTEVVTGNNTRGWIASRFLMEEQPASMKVEAATTQAEQLTLENAELSVELEKLRTLLGDLPLEDDGGEGALEALMSEMAHLRQISGKSLELDADNRRLVEEVENLRAQGDMLTAENQRLQDNLASDAFINGALAVLLGVVITLVVPRLWPRRRRNDGWA